MSDVVRRTEVICDLFTLQIGAYFRSIQVESADLVSDPYAVRLEVISANPGLEKSA